MTKDEDAADELRQLAKVHGFSERAVANGLSPRRTEIYGLPLTTLAADEERTIKVEIRAAFRPSKLVTVASMDVVRGHFWIKRSHLPRLNRDFVQAYTKIYRRRRGNKITFRPGRTTVEYSGAAGGGFKRSYLSSSVDYIPVDPLSYIEVRQILIGTEPALAPHVIVPAEFFGANRLGNGLPLSTARESISLVLKNRGDIPVRVSATILGYA